MKFGLRYLNTGPNVDPLRAVAMAQAAEEAGFESVWTVDHVVIPQDYKSAYPYSQSRRLGDGTENIDLPDPLIYMAYLAAATKQIRLATGILIVPQRNPVVTAKQLGTLDQLSGGRIDLGIGVGWLEEEFQALGVPFEKGASEPMNAYLRCGYFGRMISLNIMANWWTLVLFTVGPNQLTRPSL